ncbi:MAG: hypothetical protein GMKNLPBB_03063 [Myxococcota bacterium]|nr:hypothetical protein [Myxococcota bacterium]
MVAWWRRPVVFAAGGLLLAALGYMAAAWKKPAPISPDVPDQAVAAAPPPAAAGSVASSSPADASAVVDSAARDQTKQAPVPIPPPTRAHLWYTACKGGDQNACGRLSDCVYIGRQCGEGKLASTLDAECKQGISAACAVLGMCYEHGECGLKKDPTRAGILYGEACEGGDMPSCSRLGRCYLHGRCGLEKNRERARLYYDQACRGGDSDACKLLKALGN